MRLELSYYVIVIINSMNLIQKQPPLLTIYYWQSNWQEALSWHWYLDWSIRRVKLELTVQKKRIKLTLGQKEHKTSVVIPYIEGLSEAAATAYYRGIGLSSLFGKLFDLVVLNQFHDQISYACLTCSLDCSID